MTEKIAESARLYARADTEILAATVESGPASSENAHDQFASVIGLMEEVKKSKEEPIDAYVIAAACDPGLTAVREMVDVPVIGIGEAA